MGHHHQQGPTLLSTAPTTMSASHQLSAVPAKAAASKRKDAPRDDEDDSGSDADSDTVRATCRSAVGPGTRADHQSMINVDFDFYNLNPDVDQWALRT